MQVVQITAHGGPEVLELHDVPVPEPRVGEVLVRVLAVSVNHLDLWVRRGMPGMPIPLPHIPGSDGTGEIVAVGERVEGLEVGQRVLILPGVSSGTSEYDLRGDDHLSSDYGVRGEHCDGLDRELVCLEPRYVLPLPEGLDPIQAAAAPLVFLTAWGMLISRAQLQPGETVLVLGGSSGVGSAAIQIAKDLGARVLTTAGDERKREYARSMGADEVLDHHDPDWPREVKRLTEGRGVDVVVEHVGPATWQGSMRSLARLGRLVTCGGTTGPEVSLLLPHLFMKNLSILGSTMGPRSAFPTILDKLASGAYRPALDSVLPLSQVAEAHRRLEAGEVLGKIVLTPGS
jgi:NADPH:quinone reductase-like Zn-dependent oxidoreductase